MVDRGMNRAIRPYEPRAGDGPTLSMRIRGEFVLLALQPALSAARPRSRRARQRPMHHIELSTPEPQRATARNVLDGGEHDADLKAG